MSRLFVPIIEDEVYSLYEVITESYVSLPFEKTKIQLSGLVNEDENIYTKKLSTFFKNSDFSFKVSLNNIIDNHLFKKYTSQTESISLGLFCSAYSYVNKRELKQKYDSLIITGNYEICNKKVLLQPVEEIEKKFIALQNYAKEKENARHLFIYVNEKEIISEGYHNNILVIRFGKNTDIKFIFAEIFENDFSDKQKEIIEQLYIKNEYIESKKFISWKKELLNKECGGFLIYGKSNTGKSIIAKELCKYLFITHEVDDIVWISINDNAHFLELLQKETENSIANLNQSKSIIKESFKQDFEKLDSLLHKKKKIALVIDNIEYSFVDEVLDFIEKNYASEKQKIKLLLTSWEECKFKKYLDCFRLVEKKTGEIDFSREEFTAIILSIINSLFYKSKFYEANKESQKQLLDLLYEQCRDDERLLPGYIVPALTPLEKNDIQELIDLYKEQDIKALYSKVKVLKIQFEVIDLFAQIVLFAYLAIKDFDKPLNAEELIEIVNSKLFASDFKNKPVLTLRNIKTAIKTLEQASLLQKTNEDKYFIKKDSIKYCVFSKEDKKEIGKELATIRDAIIPVEKKIEYAIENDLYEEFEKYIEIYHDTQMLNTFLIKACECDSDISFFTSLLNKRISTDYIDKDGHTALDVYCCCGKSLEVLKLLEKKGFKYRNNLENGVDDFLLAISNESYEIIDYIMSSDFYIKIKNQVYFNSFSVLQLYALIGKNTRVFDILLEHCNIWDKRTKSGWTLLQCAALNQNSNLLKYIIKKQYYTDIDEVCDQGATALQLLCGTGTNSDSLELLIQSGANTSILSSRGQTLLHLAATNSNTNILNFLLNNGYNSYLTKTSSEGETPLELAIKYEKEMNLFENVNILKKYSIEKI